MLRENCIICLDIIHKDNRYETDCYHYFHNNCINEWKKINDKCPLCRKQFKKIKIFKILNDLFKYIYLIITMLFFFLGLIDISIFLYIYISKFINIFTKIKIIYLYLIFKNVYFIINCIYSLLHN